MNIWENSPSNQFHKNFTLLINSEFLSVLSEQYLKLCMKSLLIRVDIPCEAFRAKLRGITELLPPTVPANELESVTAVECWLVALPLAIEMISYLRP